MRARRGPAFGSRAIGVVWVCCVETQCGSARGARAARCTIECVPASETKFRFSMSFAVRRHAALDKVRGGTAGLNQLAMSMVLPHENKPVRFPVVPATLTATVDLMSDAAYSLPDGTARRCFLCRDAAYPLWVERSVSSSVVYLFDTSVVVPANPNKMMSLPSWTMTSTIGSATVDGVPTSVGELNDFTPIALVDGFQAIYIPYGADLVFQLTGAGAQQASGSLDISFVYHNGSEIRRSSVSTVTVGTDQRFIAVAGGAASVGSITEGNSPFGFVAITAIATGTTAPVASVATGTARFGWSTGGVVGSPTSDPRVVLLPFSPAPEARNSVIPYTKARLNASAALFTNVSATLSKEGTVLASRLKMGTVSPFSFAVGDLNSVHPKLRYYGPLEKGLYTFTTPSTDGEMFRDKWLTFPVTGGSSISSTIKLLFSPDDVGVYNAFIFSDLGSSTAGTQLAASCYVHLEFETVSSLFTPGVSTATLETLHAAQIALLNFGHFHENPLHFSSIMKAATAALRYVAPLVAPVVQKVGTKALSAGVSYLKGKSQGDRSMRQAQLVVPSRSRAPGRKKKNQPTRKSKKR